METIQLKTKSGNYVQGEMVMYSGNYAIVQTKEVKDGKLITKQQVYNLDDVQSIEIIRNAELREIAPSKPQLLVENDGKKNNS